MKRLSVFLLLLGILGCNYPSREQAFDACREWKEKGEKALYTKAGTTYTNPTETNAYSRYCREEATTTQFLGRESIEAARLINEGKIEEADGVEWKDYKIVKHFRY